MLGNTSEAMMDATVPLTVAETAIAADVPAKVVRHALARRLVRRLSAGREAPMASAAAFALAVLKHSPAVFGHTEQRALFDAFLNDDSTVWKIQPAAGTVSLLDDSVRTSLEAPELLRAVARRVRLLQKMHERIERNPEILSAAPVFKGTRVLVERVGALLGRGVPRTSVAQDYPQLNDEDLEMAELYVRLNPRPRGRPPKRLKLRRTTKGRLHQPLHS